MKNPFSILPENFFKPLAFGMRGHYASLLLTFYGHFLEYTGGVEKKVLLASFEEYF